MLRLLRRTPRVAAALGLVTALACAPSEGEALYEERLTLGGGEGRAFTLESGTYSLELKAEGEGVSVEWIGADCPRVERATSLSTTCRLVVLGQLVIRNPDRDRPAPVEIVVRRRRG